MCDDYDTDYDSNDEEFDRNHLIDDIQRINLALGAESDNEEDEDEVEEDETRSRFSHFKSSNLILPSASSYFNTTNQLQELPATSISLLSSEEDEHDTPTYTELKTVNITDTENQPNQTISTSSDRTTSLFNSLQEPLRSNWSVEHELYNFAPFQQDVPEISHEEVIASNFSRLEREVLQKCLAKNKEYQRQLLKEISIIDTSLADVKRKQLDLAQVFYNNDGNDDNHSIKPTPSMYKFSNPYFRDSNGMGPPDNEDAKHYRNLMAISAYEKKPINWNSKEKQLLAENIRMQNLKLRLAPLLKRLKQLESQQIFTDMDFEEIDRLKKQIEEVKSMSPKELEENLEGIDWDELAIGDIARRSAFECELEWTHFGHPRVNRKPWTKQEDKMILKLTKGQDYVNWNLAAQKLQTNRTPIECLRRYQRSLNKDLVRSKWTPEEDEQLVMLVKTFGMRNWQRIADFMEGRVGEQCMHRYMKACMPAKKGKWSDDETEKLKEAVQKHGSNWEKVSELVKGRTGTQCRERYVNVIDPNLNKGAWSSVEDEKLLQLVEKFGEGNWSKIAKELTPRTDNQCWRRWSQVKKLEAANYRLNTVRKRREEMVLNFVGRRKERPSLTPKDLDVQDLPVEISSREPKPQKERPSRRKTHSTSTNTVNTDNTNSNNKEIPKRIPKSTARKRAISLTPFTDHTYAIIPSTKKTQAKTTPGIRHETIPGGQEDDDGTVLVPSEDEWDDNGVDKIDVSALGTRSSDRRRNYVSYAEENEQEVILLSDCTDDHSEVEIQEEVTLNISTTNKENANIENKKTTTEKKKRKPRKPAKEKKEQPEIIPLQPERSFLFLSDPSFPTRPPKLHKQQSSKTLRDFASTPGISTTVPVAHQPVSTTTNTTTPLGTTGTPIHTANGTSTTTNSTSKKQRVRTSKVVIAPRFTHRNKDGTNISTTSSSGTPFTFYVLPSSSTQTENTAMPEGHNTLPSSTITPTATGQMANTNPVIPTAIAQTTPANVIPANRPNVCKQAVAASAGVPNTSEQRVLSLDVAGNITTSNTNKSVAPQTGSSSVNATTDGTPVEQTRKRPRPRLQKKVDAPMLVQNIAPKPVPQQIDLTPFYLLLQAFNINVAGVMRNLNPSSVSQAPTTTTSTNPSGLNVSTPQSVAKEGSTNSSLINKESPVVSSSLKNTPSEFKSPTSRRKSKTPRKKGEQESPRSVPTQTPIRTTASAPAVITVTSSNQAISATSSGAKPAQNKPSDESETPKTTSTTNVTSANVNKPAIIQPSDATRTPKSTPTTNTNVSVTSVPPLPPTLTTLKGLSNLLDIKKQLQRLAAQPMFSQAQAHTNTIPLDENVENQDRVISTTENTSAPSASSNKEIASETTTISARSGRCNNTQSSSAESDSLTDISKGTPVSSSGSAIENPPPSSLDDRNKALDDEGLVVVHIDSLKESIPVNYSSSDLQRINNSPTTAKRGWKKTGMRIETSNLSATSHLNRNGAESPSKALGQTTPPPVNRSNVDPFVKFALYRKTPEYKLLSSRFQSLFLWPMFMSEVAVSGRLVPIVRNQLAHVNQSPGPMLSCKAFESRRPVEPATAASTSTTTVGNDPNSVSETANQNKNAIQKGKRGRKPTKSKRSDGTLSSSKRNKVSGSKRSTDDSSSSPPSNRRKDSSFSKKRKMERPKRRIVQDESDESDQFEDCDDDYEPNITCKADNLAVTSTRTLRSRKRICPSDLETLHNSNSSVSTSQTTESLRKEYVPANKRSNKSLSSNTGTPDCKDSSTQQNSNENSSSTHLIPQHAPQSSDITQEAQHISTTVTVNKELPVLPSTTTNTLRQQAKTSETPQECGSSITMASMSTLSEAPEQVKPNELSNQNTARTVVCDKAQEAQRSTITASTLNTPQKAHSPKSTSTKQQDGDSDKASKAERATTAVTPTQQSVVLMKSQEAQRPSTEDTPKHVDVP